MAEKSKISENSTSGSTSKNSVPESAEVRLHHEWLREEERIRALGKRGLTELNRRTDDQIEVVLLWNASDNGLRVAVEDHREERNFEFPVPAESAVAVFNHPYPYAEAVGAIATSQAA